VADETIDWVGTVQVTRGLASEKSRRGHLGKRAKTGRCPQPPNFFLVLMDRPVVKAHSFQIPMGRRSYLLASPLDSFSHPFFPPLSFLFLRSSLFLVELILDFRSFFHFLEVRFFIPYSLFSLTLVLQITLFDRVHTSFSLGGTSSLFLVHTYISTALYFLT
jgi:hypothetical protein